MSQLYSKEEILRLFTYAFQNPNPDIIELAIKISQYAEVSVHEMFEAIVLHSDPDDLIARNDRIAMTKFAEFDKLLIYKLLENDDEEIQLKAISALKLLNDRSALDSLNGIIHKSNSIKLRAKAIWAYESIKSQSQAFTNLYRQSSPANELDLAYADSILDRNLSQKKVSDLMRHFFSPIANVRKRAADELILRKETIANQLFKELKTTVPPYTIQLLELLSEFRDPRSVDIIINWLNAKKDFVDYWQVLEVLKKIGGEQVISFLINIIKKSDFWSDINYAEVFEKFSKYLAPHLILAYENNYSFRRNGSVTLVKVLGKDALKSLIGGIYDRYRAIRENAELGLIILGEFAVKSLASLINSDDAILKLHICRILGKVNDTKGYKLLDRLAQDDNKQIHWAALEAMGNISSKKITLYLLKWQQTSDSKTELLVIKALGRQTDVQAGMALVSMSNNTGQKNRLEAVKALLYLVQQSKVKRDLFIDSLLSLSMNADDQVSSLTKACLVELGYKYGSVLSHIVKLKEHQGNQLDALRKIREILELIIQKKDYDKKTEYSKNVKGINESKPDLRDSFTSRRFNHFSSPIYLDAVRVQQMWRSLDITSNSTIDSIMNVEMTEEIPKPITDQVKFSVSSPLTVCLGRSFILDIWAHFDSIEIEHLAKKAQTGKSIRLRSKGPVLIDRGSVLTVKLFLPDFSIIEQEDSIYWYGITGNCTFQIDVPEKLSLGYYVGAVKFYIGPLQIAKLNFDIEVGSFEKEVGDITSREYRTKTAFASYASEDRSKVLGRIQGMLKLLPELDIFLDVVSLRSGTDWEKRLSREITIRDIFYLFWSRAASKSTWVEKEWRMALMKKGIDYIDPVPLEPPSETPPPPELAMLHFNEWTLAFDK